MKSFIVTIPKENNTKYGKYSYGNNTSSALCIIANTNVDGSKPKPRQIVNNGTDNTPYIATGVNRKFSTKMTKNSNPKIIKVLPLLNKGVKIACLEEIAYNQGFISKDDLLKQIEKYGTSNEYYNYVRAVVG